MSVLHFFTFRRRIEIQGEMPWRALLKLQRAKIPVYQAQKTQKNRLILLVNAKDIQKVFAIYPKMCYNNNTNSAYHVRDLGGIGLQKAVDFFKNRLAFVLGAALFCICSLGIEPYVFGVEIIGTQIYKREILQTLETNGVRAFSKYHEKNQDLLTSQLLALDGVEFCSVQKKGGRVVVEMRLSPFAKQKTEQGDMCSLRSGKILSFAVLRGTPLKKVGEEIQAGDKLVGGYFQTLSGEYKGVAPIARVCIACNYAQDVTAESEQQAFAIAYLQLCLGENDGIIQTNIQPLESGENNVFHVEIEYFCVQTINL